MDKNTNVIYIIGVIGVLLLAGIFFWQTQDAQAPTEEGSEMQESTTTPESSGSVEGSIEGDAMMDDGGNTMEQGDMGGPQANAPEQEGAQEPSAQEEETSGDPTADWRRYTNKGLHLSFKMPPSWHLSEQSQAGEYTLQTYIDDASGKTAEFNILYYEANLDASGEGSFSETVNGRQAHVEEFNLDFCAPDSSCTFKTVIFPLEEGEVVDGSWQGSVAQVAAITHNGSNGTLKETVDGIISTLNLDFNK